MTPKRTRYTTTMRLDTPLWEGLQRIRTRDGIPVSEQMRRAITAWLEAKGDRSPTPHRTTKGGHR
jgi:hypothetical protein